MLDSSHSGLQVGITLSSVEDYSLIGADDLRVTNGGLEALVCSNQFS